LEAVVSALEPMALSLIWIEGGSGRLIVGIGRAEAVDAWRCGVDICVEDFFSDSPRLARGFWGDFSCSRFISRGFQFCSKLTMGRPGRSLTTVGEGNFGLLSFNRMLVAALISSPRI